MYNFFTGRQRAQCRHKHNVEYFTRAKRHSLKRRRQSNKGKFETLRNNRRILDFALSLSLSCFPPSFPRATLLSSFHPSPSCGNHPSVEVIDMTSDTESDGDGDGAAGGDNDEDASDDIPDISDDDATDSDKDNDPKSE